jgi:hypothetical protein
MHHTVMLCTYSTVLHLLIVHSIHPVLQVHLTLPELPADARAMMLTMPHLSCPAGASHLSYPAEAPSDEVHVC